MSGVISPKYCSCKLRQTVTGKPDQCCWECETGICFGGTSCSHVDGSVRQGHCAVSGQAMGATPDLTVEQSTERHLKLIGKLTKEDNGKYFSAAEDKELPY